jgi:hypothetical protein
MIVSPSRDLGKLAAIDRSDAPASSAVTETLTSKVPWAAV